MVMQRNTNITCLLVIVSILIIVGFIFIYSASSVYALEKFGSAHYFIQKQARGLVIGLIALLVSALMPLTFIQRITPLAFWVSLLVTASTLLPGLGMHVHGSSRWLYLPGFSVQPSELLKITFILYIAFILAKKQYRLNSLRSGYLPFLCILGVVAVVLLKQPDFGLAVTLCVTAFLLLFVAQIQAKYLVATCIPIVPIVAWLIYSKPYRFKRILTFLNPWHDRQGAGFQIIQSLIAIGSGHITGVGIGNSRQKFFYLPMQHTDFIFSIIAEETGFMGATIIIMLYLALLYVGIRISWRLKSAFALFIVLGFTLLLSLQALINLCVTTGIVPTKGIGLPFISYGNSALISSLCMIGLIINCVWSEERQR